MQFFGLTRTGKATTPLFLRGRARPLVRWGVALLLVLAQNLSLNHHHDWVADPFGIDCDVCLQFSLNDAITAAPPAPIACSPTVADILDGPETGFSRTLATTLIRGPPEFLI